MPMRINGLYPHKYPPLIDQHLFNRVQDVFKGHGKKPFRYGLKPFAFRALLRCAECGTLISGDIKKGKYVYYYCNNYKKVHKKRLYVREEDLFNPIKKTLKKLILKDGQIEDLINDLKRSEKSKSQFMTTSLGELRKDFDLYEERKSRAFDKYMDKEISKEVYDKKIAEYDTKQANITTQIKIHQEADTEFYITIGLLLGVAQRAYSLFESSQVAEKRAIINFLLTNCKLNGKKPQF